jgi:signal transduction histidine kinase
MFLWIRDQKWLPALYLSLISLLIFGGIDYSLQGALSLAASAFLAVSIYFSRPMPWLSIALFSIGLLAPTFFGLEPQVSQISAAIALLIISGFANVIQRIVGFACSLILGLTSLFISIFGFSSTKLYLISLPTGSSKLAFAVAGVLTVIALNANAWFIGRYVFTQITHVGSEVDLANLETQVSEAQLAIAEQGRRFGVARDVTDLLLDKVSATMVSIESGSYLIKEDASAAPRLFEGISVSVKDAFAEIRRLSDLLALQETNSVALPGIRDLNRLFITYRELGFNVNFRENGPAIELVDNASLVVYRIVSESLSNVRQHAPDNTGIDVDFIWTDVALQILIKDNGEETQRINLNSLSGYSVAEDQRALTEQPTGVGLSSLAEMVRLYDATIEFALVPGVGFKVSAAFLNVAKYAKGK